MRNSYNRSQFIWLWQTNYIIVVVSYHLWLIGVEILCREQVKIPVEKPYIYLKGEGRRKTNVTWDDYGSIDSDATFFSEADYTLVKSITFIVSPPQKKIMTCHKRFRWNYYFFTIGIIYLFFDKHDVQVSLRIHVD